MKIKWMLIVTLTLTAQALTTPTRGQEFRIETDIFVAQQTKPVSENLTLFTENKVYDFLLAPSGRTPVEVVIYDFEDQSFALLDPSRKMKFEIDSQQLEFYLQSMRSDEAVKKRLPFMIEPVMDESFDDQQGWLTLKSLNLEYRCQGKPADRKHDKLMDRYYEFVDRYAQLNVTDPQKMPPFARLLLNKAIRARNWMPTAVEMELQYGEGRDARKISARSRHYVIWNKLSKKDASRIETAQSMLNEFESVNLDTYRKLVR